MTQLCAYCPCTHTHGHTYTLPPHYPSQTERVVAFFNFFLFFIFFYDFTILGPVQSERGLSLLLFSLSLHLYIFPVTDSTLQHPAILLSLN